MSRRYIAAPRNKPVAFAFSKTTRGSDHGPRELRAPSVPSEALATPIERDPGESKHALEINIAALKGKEKGVIISPHRALLRGDDLGRETPQESHGRRLLAAIGKRGSGTTVTLHPGLSPGTFCGCAGTRAPVGLQLGLNSSRRRIRAARYVRACVRPSTRPLRPRCTLRPTRFK
ncbi:hypothetical protein MRX96_047881 [Rhipicephalus microplus]